MKDPSPLVGSGTIEQYRIYLTWEYRNAKVKSIGRAINTGTGNTGEVLNPQPGQTLTSESGLPEGTLIEVRDNENANWRRWHFQFPVDSATKRIGVFYATAVHNNDEITISTVKTSEAGTTYLNQKVSHYF